MVEQIAQQSNYRTNVTGVWHKLAYLYGRIEEEETEDHYMKLSFLLFFLTLSFWLQTVSSALDKSTKKSIFIATFNIVFFSTRWLTSL